MAKNTKFFQYFREYQWSDIFAMIKNNRRDPEICEEDFQGKWVVITGATSGIGRVTANKYASHGANLFCINRNPKKSEDLQIEIESRYGVECKFHLADRSSLKDIRKAANRLLKFEHDIDVLIHNAGVYLTKKEVSMDGLEKVLVVHHLSSFMINFLLMDKLKAQESSRIILVNSEGHRFAAWGLKFDDLNWNKRRYSGLKSYGSAKTAQLLSLLIFDDFFQDSGVSINAMHPGAVKTETGQDNGPLYKWFKKNFYDKTLKSPEISAEALYYLGVSKEVEGLSSRFFNLTREEKPAPPASDKEMAFPLWEKSLELTGLKK